MSRTFLNYFQNQIKINSVLDIHLKKCFTIVMKTKTTKTGSIESANFVKKSRQYLKLNHNQMGEVCGVSRVLITKYENEYAEPPGRIILRIAEKLSNGKLIELLKRK